MAVVWEMAAHSACNMFSVYMYLISTDFPTLVFGVGISFLCAISWSLFTFTYVIRHQQRYPLGL